jgi:hypothetical protein
LIKFITPLGTEFKCRKLKINNKIELTCLEETRDTPCPQKEEITPEYREVILELDEDKRYQAIFYVKEV